MKADPGLATIFKVCSALPASRPSLLTSLGVSVFFVAAAAMARGAFGPLVAESQFITFFSAALLATLVGGVTGGLVAVGLSAVVWWLLFASVEPGLLIPHLVPAGLFVVMSSILVIAVGAMRVAFAETYHLRRSLETQVGQMQHSKDLLGSVIEGMPDAVFLLEGHPDDLRFVYVNSAGELFLDGRGQDVIGKRDREVISPAHAAENQQVLTSKQPLRVRERLLETSDGQKCVEVRKFPLAGTNGHPTLLTVLRDVTEVRELEDSLRQRHRIDALGQLTGGIAHDFNNLLAIALGNLELLEDNATLNPDAKELLEDAKNACLRGADLTSRLLAFARKQTLEPVPVAVNGLLSDYTKLMARLLGADIDLQLKLSDGLWHATADRAQLEAAITNLATNARDAMPNGGRLTISTRNEMLETSYTGNHPGLEPGEYVAVEVSDTGHGMSPEVQAKAVEPFFTTKAEGHGTGLGLSMVFGFAKQSGGHVRIYSETGQGTTVTLLLPRAQSTRTDEVPERVGPPEAGGGEIVLVVDDNSDLRRMTVKQLSSLGYTVLEAEDGPSALGVLTQESRIDLMLTDIVMPGGLSGVDLGREVRQLRPEIKLIYMSGFPEVAFGDRADLERDVMLLRKPFRKAELAVRVREVLDTNNDRN